MLSSLIPKDNTLKYIFILWFILAVTALAFSGLYSFLPYALRTPYLSKLINMHKLFDHSLMVHVNLGVLVWFLSINAMLMNIVIKEKYSITSFVSFISSMIGTIFIITSPFIGASEPVKNNYIPILHNFTFILGIALFLSGILLQSVLTILSLNQVKGDLIRLSIYLSAIIFIIASIAFSKSVIDLNNISKTRFIDLMEYYELLFWGAGHILQFNYIQLIFITWIIILFKLAPKLLLPTYYLKIVQWINFVLVAPTIIIYWIYPVDSLELYEFFTLHMKYVGGILISLTAIWAAYIIFSQKLYLGIRFEFWGFIASCFLIINGGVIGYLISGANVTIPAHYHGVILGITVGLMTLFYTLLPDLGFKKANNKNAIWQIILYTIGQFIHIIALAISGGYGVLRKDPNSPLSLKAKIFMGAMGIGGSIALIGGILFVVLIVKNLRVIEEQA